MEDVAFIKHLSSVIKQAQCGKVILLAFLDETKKQEIRIQAKKNDVDVSFDGGFINAEYERCIIGNSSNKDFKIAIFRIDYNKKYYQLTHREILGSLMSLGIKRDTIGDIYITSDNDCYFACKDEISSFLINEAKYISNVPIRLVKTLEKITIIKEYILTKYIVASLRLDVIISSVYNLSRKETFEIISNNDVKINHIDYLNNNKIIKECDLISVRHYGRFTLDKILGKTKSEKIIIMIKKDR